MSTLNIFILTNLLLIPVIIIGFYLVTRKSNTPKTDTTQQEFIFSQFKYLTENVNQAIENLNSKLDNKLTQNTEKNHQTFTDIVKRLAIIDTAQNRLTDLSKDVIDLQSIFKDKKSRGAFGEIQLNYLIENMLPRENYELQYKLSTSAICDCALKLPQPTGLLCVDSKFPLESYQKDLKSQFKIDIKKHLTDIADKYIISNETANYAIMFLPSEAIFAEIHSNYPELIDLSHKLRVYIASPTTMMAIITTASSVIKDNATFKQINVIKEHLVALDKDFDRFMDRMDKLARDIDKVHADRVNVEISAKKISSRFKKIESADVRALELEHEEI